MWKRFSSGVGAQGAHADPVAMKKSFEGLAAMVAFLPKLKKEKTAPTNFKDRLEQFGKLLAALPPSTRESLFKGIEVEALRKLYDAAPERACRLLDRLFAQSRIILS